MGDLFYESIAHLSEGQRRKAIAARTASMICDYAGLKVFNSKICLQPQPPKDSAENTFEKTVRISSIDKTIEADPNRQRNQNSDSYYSR